MACKERIFFFFFFFFFFFIFIWLTTHNHLLQVTKALQHISNAESHLKAAAYDRCVDVEGLRQGKEKAAEMMGDTSLVSSTRFPFHFP